MKTTIEKSNGQIFEVLSSEKDAKEYLTGWILPDIDDTWNDEDSSLYIEYKDGTTFTASYVGDTMKGIKKSNIKKMHYSNTGSEVIYNCEIVYNEHYEDWEIA